MKSFVLLHTDRRSVLISTDHYWFSSFPITSQLTCWQLLLSSWSANELVTRLQFARLNGKWTCCVTWNSSHWAVLGEHPNAYLALIAAVTLGNSEQVTVNCNARLACGSPLPSLWLLFTGFTGFLPLLVFCFNLLALTGCNSLALAGRSRNAISLMLSKAKASDGTVSHDESLGKSFRRNY